MNVMTSCPCRCGRLIIMRRRSMTEPISIQHDDPACAYFVARAKAVAFDALSQPADQSMRIANDLAEYFATIAERKAR
jgi:hypothetical protein